MFTQAIFQSGLCKPGVPCTKSDCLRKWLDMQIDMVKIFETKVIWSK